MTVKQAVDTLTAALSSDRALFQTYQANIAMAVYDAWYNSFVNGDKPLQGQQQEMHQLCNTGAIRFLNLLCQDGPRTRELTGAEEIAEERVEHTIKHGWDLNHDQYYDDGELARAAVACLLALPDVKREVNRHSPREVWPWETVPFFTKIERKNAIGILRVAGSFCAAEIDRLKAEERADQLSMPVC